MIRNVTQFLQKNKIQVFLISVFSVVFSLICLVNHYLFRTDAYDLGIFNHALYDYSRFRFNEATLLFPFVEISNILADHFSVLQILFTPLIFIFGTYTLLLVQMALIFIGAWGIRRYVALFTTDSLIPVLAQIHFFVSFGVIAALGYDYHDSVMASMFVPHLLYYSEKKNWRGFIFMAVLILLSRVELSIWFCFICFALFLSNLKSSEHRKYLSLFAVVAFAYFMIIIKVVIPYISADGYTQFHFSVLGENMTEALFFSIKHPFTTISYMFQNQHGGPIEAYYIKRDFYRAFLISGGFLLIFRPAFILMLFPVVAQRMLNDESTKWGINGHYSIESVTLLSLCVYAVIGKIRQQGARRTIGIVLMLITGLTTLYYMKNRKPEWKDTVSENIFISWHYRQDFDAGEVHRALNQIPEDVVVSAQSSLVPHLCFRDKIYLYPYIDDAEYIVLNEKTTPYPMIREDYFTQLENLKNSPEWNLLYDSNFTYIFRKTGSGKE